MYKIHTSEGYVRRQRKTSLNPDGFTLTTSRKNASTFTADEATALLERHFPAEYDDGDAGLILP